VTLAARTPRMLGEDGTRPFGSVATRAPDAGVASGARRDAVPDVVAYLARRRRSRAVKRAIDVLGAGLALVVLAPLMGLIALAILVQSPGPVLFRQARVGRDGRLFVMLKFRTMVVDADEQAPALIAFSRDPDWLHLENDPRITPLGRRLRRTSLDELPQLWNVFAGDMSLVGPRPLVPLEHARVPSWALARCKVAPGITGLWQVNGRTDISFAEMMLLDLLYVATWSVWRDVVILLRTVPAVLTGKGTN
jgi:lipopolysaccharide/colanic/teichoic acid biosynthesis glycosyltransferase